MRVQVLDPEAFAGVSGAERRKRIGGTAEGRFADVAGAVLVGGASTRMGTDKARLELGGVPLAVRTARILASLCEDVIWSAARRPPARPAARRRIRRARRPRCAGSSARSRRRARRACSWSRPTCPGSPPDLLLALVALPEADVVAAARRTRGPSRSARSTRASAVLPKAREHLAAGRLALRELLAELGTSPLAGAALRTFDPDGAALANANTPDDWARARARAEAADR